MALSSLAAYSSSSESEAEEEGPPAAKRAPVSTPLIQRERDRETGRVKLFLPQLPPPRSGQIDQEQDNTSVVAKGRKGGLVAILPQPKNKRTLIKPQQSTSSSSSSPVGHGAVVAAAAVSVPLFKPYSVTSKGRKDANDSSDEENDPSSFLFFNDKREEDSTPSYDIPSLSTSVTQPNASTVTANASVSGNASVIANARTVTGNTSVTGNASITSTVSEPALEGEEREEDDDLPLNEDIVRRLAGKRRGQRRDEESLSLQRVKNVTETAVKDSVKSYQKYSTVQSSTSGTVPEHLAFTGDQKRKHQITWLAHQAKSREIELKNFWAESASIRNQTRMKYGF